MKAFESGTDGADGESHGRVLTRGKRELVRTVVVRSGRVVLAKRWRESHARTAAAAKAKTRHSKW